MRERTSTILTVVFLTGAIALADWKTGPKDLYLTKEDMTSGTNIVWQYDANREWNKSIEEKKERDEQAYKAFLASSPPDNVIFVSSGESRIRFDFRAQTTCYELGYRPDGIVVWRKTPEREEKK